MIDSPQNTLHHIAHRPSIDSSELRETTPIQVNEPVSENGKYVTEEEYWEKYYKHPHFNYEWNNGILEEIGRRGTLSYDSYAEYEHAKEECMHADHEHTSFLYYQELAEQARQRAEQSRIEAEYQHQRAERLAARLRALGLTEDVE